MQSYIKNNFRPYFGDEVCIEDLTRDELDNFFFYLREDKELSGGTVNKNINCANVGFKHLVDTGKLKPNPLSEIEKFKPENKERGIPSEEEVKKTFAD